MKYTGKPTTKKNPESLVGYDTPSLVGTPPAKTMSWVKSPPYPHLFGVQIPITTICSILKFNLPVGVGLEGSSKNKMFNFQPEESNKVSNMTHEYLLS